MNHVGPLAPDDEVAKPRRPTHYELVLPPTAPPEKSPFDQHRWVKDHDQNLGFLGSNPHTHIGRFSVWWTQHQGAYSTSLYDLAVCSGSAAQWLLGFLSGSEPSGWFGDDFDYDDQDPRTPLWRTAVAGYHLTGTWKLGRRCQECDVDLLPSAPVGFRCAAHGGALSSQWPTVTTIQ